MASLQVPFDRSLGLPSVDRMHLMPFLLPTNFCDSENASIITLAHELIPAGSTFVFARAYVQVCVCVSVCDLRMPALLRRHVSWFLQDLCVAACCSGLQWVAMYCSTLQYVNLSWFLQDLFVAVCCSVLQRVAMCCRMLQYVHLSWFLQNLFGAACSNVLQCVAACCTALQYIAVCAPQLIPTEQVCCSVLQCVAACCNVLHYVTVCAL